MQQQQQKSLLAQPIENAALKMQWFDIKVQFSTLNEETRVYNADSIKEFKENVCFILHVCLEQSCVRCFLFLCSIIS